VATRHSDDDATGVKCPLTNAHVVLASTVFSSAVGREGESLLPSGKHPSTSGGWHIGGTPR